MLKVVRRVVEEEDEEEKEKEEEEDDDGVAGIGDAGGHASGVRILVRWYAASFKEVRATHIVDTFTLTFKSVRLPTSR